MSTGPENFQASIEARVVDAQAARDIEWFLDMAEASYDPNMVWHHKVRLLDTDGDTIGTDTHLDAIPGFLPKYAFWKSDNANVAVGLYRSGFVGTTVRFLSPHNKARWCAVDCTFAFPPDTSWTHVFIAKEAGVGTASTVDVLLVGVADLAPPT